MITKALPIPVVTPFPIFRGQYALSLPFIFAKATSRACIFICTVGDCPRLNASAFGLSTLWLRSPGAAGQVEIKNIKKTPWNGRMPGICFAWHLLWKSLFKNSNCLLGAAFCCFILWFYYMEQKWMEYVNLFNDF